MNIGNNLNELCDILNEQKEKLIHEQQQILDKCVEDFIKAIKWDGPSLTSRFDNDSKQITIGLKNEYGGYSSRDQLVKFEIYTNNDNRLSKIYPMFDYNYNVSIDRDNYPVFYIYKIMYLIESIIDINFDKINEIFKPLLDSYKNDYLCFQDKLKVYNLFINSFSKMKTQMKIDNVFETGEANNARGIYIHKAKGSGTVYVDTLKVVKNTTGTYHIKAYLADDLKTEYTRASEDKTIQLIKTFFDILY